MSELLILDPDAVAEDRVEVDITKFVGETGPDFGDAQIEAYLAEAERGQLPVDFRIPNRQIQIPLILTDRGDGRSFDDIRRQVQAKVALFQREGGWLQRDTQVGSVYADIVDATLKLGAGFFAAAGTVDPDAVLTLECLPDWYGDEVALDAITETVHPEIAAVLKLNGEPATIQGDYPGRCRLVVTELQGEDQLAIFGGFRSRHYDDAATSALAYQAGDLTPLDTAATASSAGAAGTVIRHDELATIWTPVLSTELLAGGDLTHVGSYRVRARVRSYFPPIEDAPETAADVQLRLLYDVGDMTLATTNNAVETGQAFAIVDLGAVRIDRAPVGTHRWRAHLQAKGATVRTTIEIDRLWLLPLDESAFMVSAPLVADDGLTSFAVRDAFNQGAAALNGQDIEVGPGSWSSVGDSDDFSTTGSTLTRTATSDSVIVPAGRVAGRLALAGSTTFTAAVAQAEVQASADVSCLQGVLMRVVDATHFVAAVVNIADGYAAVIRCRTGFFKVDRVTLPFTARIATAYTVRGYLDEGGRYAIRVVPPGGQMNTPLLTGQDPELATGGALDDGKAGVIDAQASGTANTRTYENFAAWAPVGDSVVYGFASAELRTDGMFREIESGYGYGPISRVIGDLPRIPPSGLEQRPVEVLLKGSRGDLADLPDPGIDDMRMLPYYRPSWLFVPEI